jgi:hypothetical protein
MSTQTVKAWTRIFRRSRTWVMLAFLAVIAAALVLFPGPRLGIAFTLGTGIGVEALQARIDELEAKAIRRTPLLEGDRAFLVDFYSTLATGGKLSLIARQTGKMMDHYLSRAGTPYELEPEIFAKNRRVQSQAELLRKRATRSKCGSGERFKSPTFYMPDRSQWDSVFGLYHGTLELTKHLEPDGGCRLHFRAEVPWIWPSYASLTKKYGSPHAESFPLPNVRSLVLGHDHGLYVDNGLGHYLEEVGIARSFLAFAEWSEAAKSEADGAPAQK